MNDGDLAALKPRPSDKVVLAIIVMTSIWVAILAAYGAYKLIRPC